MGRLHGNYVERDGCHGEQAKKKKKNRKNRVAAEDVKEEEEEEKDYKGIQRAVKQ